jgi:5-methylcytosine-specific restriction endonuclease McrA
MLRRHKRIKQNLAKYYFHPIEVLRIVIPEKARKEIYERHGCKCVKCGSAESLQLDHIIPFSKGGKTIKTNLQTLCKKCNLGKRNNGMD